MEFEWDEIKATSNRQKHGVAFEEATTVFGDPLASIFADPDHSDEEIREILVGYSEQNRLLVVSFTERGDCLRIISARVATTQERHNHENQPRQGTGP